jgi:hypothetical protein
VAHDGGNRGSAELLGEHRLVGFRAALNDDSIAALHQKATGPWAAAVQEQPRRGVKPGVADTADGSRSATTPSRAMTPMFALPSAGSQPSHANGVSIVKPYDRYR